MAGIRPNRPARTPEVPFKIKEENAGASKSAAAPAGKGKEPAKLTPQEEAKIAKRQAKEKAAEAAKTKFDAEVVKENKRIGAGTSGTAGKSLPNFPTSSKGTLARTQSLPNSSSVGSNLSELSLPSSSADSSVPSWVGGDKTPPHGSEASTKYFTATTSFGSTSDAETSAPSSLQHTRSMSDGGRSALSLNPGNLQDFILEMKAVKGRTITPGVYHTETTKVVLNEPALDVHGKKVVEKVISAHLEPQKVDQPEAPLMWSDFPHAKEAKRMIPPSALKAGMNPNDHLVAIPEIGSGPSTPKVKPSPDQAGRPAFPDSTSLSSLLASSPTSSTNWELPVTKWPEPPGPQKQNALGNLSTKAKVGLAAAAGLMAGGALAAGMLDKGDDSDKDVQM